MSEKDVSISFAGCGFLGLYHVGAVRCIQENAPNLLEGNFLGCSVGGLISTSIIIGCSLDRTSNMILEFSSNARSRFLGPFHPFFNPSKILKRIITDILPPNAYQLCTNRLYLSLTRVTDGSNVIVSEFTSNKELTDALLCSCHIPIFSGLVPPKFRGVFYVDGFLSNNLLSFGDDTITVSPFCGSVDICPKDCCEMPFDSFLGTTPMQFSLFNFLRLINVVYPPSSVSFENLARQGYHDALRFLTSSQSCFSPLLSPACQCCIHAHYTPMAKKKSPILLYTHVLSSVVFFPLQLLLSLLMRFVAYCPDLFVDLRIVVGSIHRRSKRKLKRSVKKMTIENSCFHFRRVKFILKN